MSQNLRSDEGQSPAMQSPGMQSETWDVVVVGAGPAGAAASTLLARQGHKVLVVEKDHFPRYRVGESLIPYCWFALDRLGVIERLDASDFVVRKHSVQFAATDGSMSAPFYFYEHTEHDMKRTWQVVRSRFDQMMMDNATESGATFRQGVTARRLLREGGDEGKVVGVQVRGEDGQETELRATMTLDCSGRDTFSQQKNEWRKVDPELSKMAVWAYYEGGKRDPGLDEGATTIAYIPEKGWFWYIPLVDDIVSVGVVAEPKYLYREGRDLEAILKREIGIQKWVSDHLQGARQVKPAQATGDYSFRSSHCAEDGLLLVGDAFAFLDPVFSSGVFLALQSGVMAADAVHEALEAGDTSAARFADYGEQFISGIEAMRRLVYAFYDRSFNFASFLMKHPEMKQDLTDCLIGASKDFDPLFKAVAEFANIPEPLAHGRPLVPSS